MLEKEKKILFITNNLNQWGQKYIFHILKENFQLVVLQTDRKARIPFPNINLYEERKVVGRFETFLRLFIIPPNTTNYRYGKKRNYLMGEKTLKSRIFYIIQFYGPKLFSENFAANLLSHLHGNFDNLLSTERPDLILNLAFFTPLYPSVRAKKLGYKVYNLIYSWDNPFKDLFLPKIFDKYLVWNEEAKIDLQTLHNIPGKRQKIINPIQFDYLRNPININTINQEMIDFVKSVQRQYYVFLFGCGYAAAEQEVSFFIHLIKIIHQLNPNRKILVRPYPNVPNVNVYDIIKKIPNVFFQDNVKQKIIQNSADIHQKKYLLKNAKTIINLGTTMSLEASFFDVPILQLAYLPDWICYSNNKKKRVLDIDYIMKNDHLHKYLIKTEYKNVIKSDEHFSFVINEIEKGKSKDYIEYTKYLRHLSQPDVNKTSAELLLKELRE